MDIPASPTPAYDLLARRFAQLHRLEHLQSIAGWDQSALMPPKGNDARSAAMAEMAALLHRLRTEAGLRADLDRAEDEPLAEAQRANLREMRRSWQASNALPESLVEQFALATARTEHAWRTQRPANDWAGLLPNLREVVALVREQAARLVDLTGGTRYDALLDRFEPGMTGARLDEIFGDVRQWLPGLIDRAIARQASEPVVQPQGPFPVDRQQWLCVQVAQRLGFDFDAGRLDTSAHPFSGGVPEDVRLTTRYSEAEFVGSLMSTVHETGHGRYEQNRPRDWIEQPLSESRSMAIHESQSLSFEMQLGCHPGFVAQIAPLIVQAFGPQPAFEAGNLARLFTRVKRGLIRVDADEVTYPAHVILRYEIERDLVEGRIEVEDIPALWDAKMAELLGVDTRGNHADGAMQDVHWPSGLIGYFPCYSLGAMYAAQWFAAIRRAAPDLDSRIAAGDFAPVFDWLKTHIWSAGSRWMTDELAVRASGEPLNPAHFKAHLERRYLGG